MSRIKLTLSQENQEILSKENLNFFSSIGEYTDFIFNSYSFHDAMVKLNTLNNEIKNKNIRTKDNFYIIANRDVFYLDIEDFFTEYES